MKQHVLRHDRPRIVLYSHDTLGLGHIRRNLLIANALSGTSIKPNILLATGSIEATQFALPFGVDCLVLPALYKEADGTYSVRRMKMPIANMIDLRRGLLKAALDAFDPDLFVVDNVPGGALMELDTTLALLRKRGRCRIVLGLRDILDEADVVEAEWRKAGRFATIRAFFDEIWIYGDPAVCPAVDEYRFPRDIAAKAHYTGYLDQRKRPGFASPESEGEMDRKHQRPDEGLVLCCIGGGQDGQRLAETFVGTRLPPGSRGLLLTGPHMDRRVRRRLALRAKNNPRMDVVGFVPEPTRLLNKAGCIVSMGGYNTVSEILSFGKRALIVPRVAPRREQMIRALRLQKMGVVDMLHPDDLNEDRLEKWIDAHLGLPPCDFRGRINLMGLDRIQERFTAIIDHPPRFEEAALKAEVS